MTDRFSSNEEVDWATGPFNDGYEARVLGVGISRCPSEDTIGRFASKSWRAGWSDADAFLASHPQPWDSGTPE